MFYFEGKDTEVSEVRHFQTTCVYNGLNLSLSEKAVQLLHSIAQRKKVDGVKDFPDFEFWIAPYFNVLVRKGLITKNDKGVWHITAVGKAMLVICDAAGLIKEE